MLAGAKFKETYLSFTALTVDIVFMLIFLVYIVEVKCCIYLFRFKLLNLIDLIAACYL